MDYIAVIVFLALHYLRPQEWSPGITAMRPVYVAAAMASAAIVTRGKSIRLRDVCGTPHDLFVLAYFSWTIIASPTPGSTFRDILPLIFFYFVAVLALYSAARLKNFLMWWAVLIIIVAALALASKVGFDPLGSLAVTEGRMKGRLALNLSIFDNPNALGHSMVPAIPILYYLVFWRKALSKVTILLLIIPLTCIFLTQSKGAFLSAAITVFSTLAFGRPKAMQIGLICVAITFGGTFLSILPRMQELEKTKSDSAIQGRVAAFRFGLEQMRRHRFGHGLGNFQREFAAHGPTTPVKKTISVNGHTKVQYVQRHYKKAPHSAYNQNGADLGYIGLFLFIGILYCSIRTLTTATTANDEEELLRRALFGVVVSYIVSSWMVDFCYRPTFFFFTAAVSDFHRLLRFRKREDDDEEPEAEPVAALLQVKPAWLARYLPTPAGAGMNLATSETPPSVLGSPNGGPGQTTPLRGNVPWDRLGLIDLLFTFVLTESAIRVWIYAIGHM